MPRSAFKRIPPRYVAVAIAFVLTAVTAYQMGRRRGPEPAEAAGYDEGEAEPGEAAPTADEPAPTADERAAAAASAELARQADAGPPAYFIVPEPPPRPPREVLIVGKRPAPVVEEPEAAEPVAPPVVAPAPAATAPPPPAELNPDVTHSHFDDQDRIEHHPVPDRGALTRSTFDDEAHIDRHPVP